MALVRVYCGLASAELRARPAAAGAWLTVAIVDDAGRLLDVCDVGDDAAGYAHLGRLLAERSGGPSGGCIAADSDDHLVTMLLTAAGRPLAFADDDLVDDFAERFADDESIEEIESPAAVRRAIGLARALQAGALSAVAAPAPRDLATLKPVLAAHSAIAVGRHAAAVALREVLRELYPAALRAYPDPAERVCLAVLDALPEPGLVTAPPAGRGRDSGHALDAVTAALTGSGIADGRAAGEAVTALRVAVSETPNRGVVSRSAAATVAETVRQAIAAVRAFDAASGALISALAERANPPASPRVSRLTQPGAQAPVRASHGVPDHGPAAEPGQVRVPIPRRARPVSPAAGPVPAPAARPVSASPLPSRPVSGSPLPEYPPAAAYSPAVPASAPPAATFAVSAPPAVAHPASAPPAPHPVSGAPASSWPASAPPTAMRPASAPPATSPVSGAPAAGHGPAVPPPPPGITPIPRRPTTSGSTRPGNARPASAPPAYGPPPRRPVAAPPPPAPEPVRAPERGRAPEPFRSPEPVSPAPVHAPAAAAPAAAPPRAGRGPGFGITDYSPPVAPRRSAEESGWRGDDPGSRRESAPPGSRANWPLVSPYDDADLPVTGLEPLPERREGRVKPPWQSDDMPPEPPMLRLVEPPPLADPALRDPFSYDVGGDLPTDARLDPPPLRLVEGEGGGRGGSRARRNGLPERPAAPASSESNDDDLLIFAAAKSAWFTGRDENEPPAWETSADQGWRAAEQAARPAVGDSNTAGLPRRVPQANLVPGSPIEPDRPLRIVRDPGRIAEHTTGYFRGWRRGREIGGYAVGGRPGRDSAHGWDFSRDDSEYDPQQFEYRQAAFRS